MEARTYCTLQIEFLLNASKMSKDKKERQVPKELLEIGEMPQINRKQCRTKEALYRKAEKKYGRVIDDIISNIDFSVKEGEESKEQK